VKIPAAFVNQLLAGCSQEGIPFHVEFPPFTVAPSVNFAHRGKASFVSVTNTSEAAGMWSIEAAKPRNGLAVYAWQPDWHPHDNARYDDVASRITPR
jgi:hypothetical protein